MYINITDSETGNNKGSSAALVSYLEKENRMQEQNEREPENWFNGISDMISPQEVRVRVDNNIAKLGKNDAKFFLINISPSQREVSYLKEKFGIKGAEEKLKEYAINVMDSYAANFKRPGIVNNQDLLWYGKLEQYRYYRHNDEEVKQGLATPGDKKRGDQMHVQVIVSRKDVSNIIKLSPMNNSRGRNVVHSEKLGQFDRRAFKESGELIFDNLFGFDREVKESILYALTMKNGSADEKMEMFRKEKSKNILPDSNQAGHYERESNPALNSNYDKDNAQSLLELFSGRSDEGLFDIIGALLPGVQGEDYEEQAFENEIKKKKRKPGLK